MAVVRTTHELNIPGTDVWITPDGPTPDVHQDVWARPEGDGWLVSWLVADYDRIDLFEWDDPDTDPAAWVNGCFRDFRNSRDGGGQEARDDFYREMVEAVGEDRVFVVEVYSHGLESFSVVGAKWYPDRRWDVAPACVLAVPSDVTNPRRWADDVMESYTSWVNGDVWGVVVAEVGADGQVKREDSCWGFIGLDHAEDAAKNFDV